MDPQMEHPAPTSPPQPHRSSRYRRKPLLIAATITVLAAAAAIAYGVIFWTHRDEDQIRKTVEKFAHAADREDRAAMMSMLCEEEAQSLTADGEPSSDDRVLGPTYERPIKVSNISVTGDVAQARVTRPAQHPATLYLRKETGTWKLCDPERYTSPPG